MNDRDLTAAQSRRLVAARPPATPASRLADRLRRMDRMACNRNLTAVVRERFRLEAERLRWIVR